MAGVGLRGQEREGVGWILAGITYVFQNSEIHIRCCLEERLKERLLRQLQVLSLFCLVVFCRNFRGNSHFSVFLSILYIKHTPFIYSNQTFISLEKYHLKIALFSIGKKLLLGQFHLYWALERAFLFPSFKNEEDGVVPRGQSSLELMQVSVVCSSSAPSACLPLLPAPPALGCIQFPFALSPFPALTALCLLILMFPLPECHLPILAPRHTPNSSVKI